ncbi:MAG: tetratricopeptide repeat protein [Edaphobacter sp.]|nr:tetratricopeptide repeat protein [Edaphobacter sp.]
MIHATSFAAVSANASKKICHPERCAKRESKDLQLPLFLQSFFPNQIQKHGWDCISLPSQLLPLLPGTPRLQPWVSTRRNEKGALAPGVCSPIPCRKSSRPKQGLVQASSLLFLIILLAPSLQAQLPAGTTDTTQPTQTQQDPLRTQANEALDKHDYATALKLLTTLTEKNPTDAHLQYDLASTQDALDQTSTAEQTYRRAIATDATYFDPHLALGLLLARAGKLPEAHTELTTATTLSGSPALKARAYRGLARIDQTTRPADASADLLAALKLSPETPDDILLTGELAESSGDPTAAETAYRRLLAANPQNLDATAALTHLLLHQQKPEEAEAALTAALAKNPDDPTLNAQLASLYDTQNQPEKALPIIEKLHTTHPTDPNLTRLLARLYTRNKQYDKAAPLYTTLLAATPQDPTLLDDTADTQIHLRNFAEAEALLKRALAQPSAFPTKDDLGLAASHLAFAASQNNHPATTLQALAIRDKVLPQSPSSLFLAATAHDKLHQVKLASDLYKQFLSVAGGKFPDEEWEARHRLVTLDHMK